LTASEIEFNASSGYPVFMWKTPRQIVIIGAGASGTIACAQILKQSGDQNIQISWVGNQTPFALGVAYSTTDIEHLLNVKVQAMSAFPSEPDHLVNWIKKHHGDWNLEKSPFVPRLYFGEYLRQLVDEKDPRVKRYLDEAMDVETLDGRYQVTTRKGERLPADDIVLAMGNLRTETRVGNILPHELLQMKDLADKKILLVGTGLTMFDTVVSLRKMGLKYPITAISRRGLIPRPHQTYNPIPASNTNATSAFAEHIHEALLVKSSLAKALRIFRDECRLAQKMGSDWRAVYDLIRPKTQFFWQEMSPSLKARFAKHLRPYWDVHRHRVAPEIESIIQGMLKAGTLKVLRQRASKTFASQFDLQVDCAGFAYDVKSSLSPLTHSLVKKGLVEVDQPAFSFHGHPAHPHIYVTGPLLKGLLWEAVAIPEIRVFAEQLARQLATTSFNLKK
jgi:uncharacterized NAD(P)/FAD-binding protein YdhS